MSPKMQYHASTDEVNKAKKDTEKERLSAGRADARMCMEVLSDTLPPISDETLMRLAIVLEEHSIGLPTLAAMGHRELMEEPFKVGSVVDRARIMAAVNPSISPCAPPPTDALGGPVIIRPKVGFTNLSEVDTLTQTLHVRFFVDHYWVDPRMKGESYVPEGIWRPTDCYIANQRDVMELVTHVEKPEIADLKDGVSANGMLLWPTEYVGTLSNPMSLRAFPFDSDHIEIILHQSESSQSEDYIFRPYVDPKDEAMSVRFFCSIFENLTEWRLRGFHKKCFESVGGIPKPFSKMVLTLHMSRRWKYYLFKVVFPLLTCTVFCFFSFFFAIDETEARLTVSTTMFLATSALLYVIGTEVPKTSYLTVIDQLVVSVLTIQFLIAFYCCVLAALHSSDQSIDSIGQPFYGLLNLIPMAVFGVMQIAAAVKYFFLPAWRTERDALDAWPISLKRKTQNPLNELFGADGSRIGWEDSEGPEDPKPSRFFLFKEFAFRPSDNTASGNVFNSMQPGTNHPGELDSPVWKPKDAKPLTA